MCPALIFWADDPDTWRHLAHAVRRHLEVLDKLQRPGPLELGELARALGEIARQEASGDVRSRQHRGAGAAAADDQAVWLTTTEAAQRLGLSERTVQRRIQDGSLPSRTIGRARRIPRAAVDELSP